MTDSEEDVKKKVDVIIKIFHEGNVSARKLALEELVALGKKAVPYIVAYLRKEELLEADLKYLEKPTGAAYWIFKKRFKEQWKHESAEYEIRSSKTYQSRKNAVQGTLEALDMLGAEETFPTLNYLRANSRFP